MARPGPKTPEGRARMLANLDSEIAPLKHGLRRFETTGLFMPCAGCIIREECEAFSAAAGASCALAVHHQQRVTEAIMALPHIEAVDRPLVTEYARMSAALAVADLYLSKAGALLPGADKGLVEYQPGVRTRMEFSTRLEKLANTLGLSPMQRAKLKRAEAPAGLIAAHAALAAEREAALDVEFDAEDEDDAE